MRIRLAVPDAAITPEVLDTALEAVTRTNERLLQDGVVPTASEAIRRGVKWRPEPPGDEHFDHAKTVHDRGHGDCDDLAPWHAASLRITGQDPDAKAIVLRSGPKRWHAVVERSDGTIDDPSAEAGMYQYRSPVQPKLRTSAGKPAIHTTLVGGTWCARCDVPWHGTNYALSSHAAHPSRTHAIRRAVTGACIVGDASGAVHPDLIHRLAMLDELLRGVPSKYVEHACAEYMRQRGKQVVGSLFGSILKTATSLAPIPGAGLISQMIPESPEKLFSGGGGGGRKAAPGPAAAPGYGPSAGPSSPFGPAVGPSVSHVPVYPPAGSPIVVVTR